MPHLHFKGKTFVQNHHLAVPFHQLTKEYRARISALAVVQELLKGISIK
jgi:hypothetical protein